MEADSQCLTFCCERRVNTPPYRKTVYSSSEGSVGRSQTRITPWERTIHTVGNSHEDDGKSIAPQSPDPSASLGSSTGY